MNFSSEAIEQGLASYGELSKSHKMQKEPSDFMSQRISCTVSEEKNT
jgi:hypothetical protein